MKYSLLLPHSKNIFVFAFMILFVELAHSQTTITKTYTSGTGTFTVPAGVNSITVKAWGGGGRGGPNTTGTGQGRGGGGGGAYATKTISVTPGTQYTYTVGDGSNTPAVNGGTSTFVGPGPVTEVSAVGGVTSTSTAGSGAGGAGGLASACIPTLNAMNGGNGANGSNISIRGGGGGGGAGSTANGNNGSAITGGLAILQNGSNTGAGGNGGNASTGPADGFAGSAYGGGGGGAGQNGTSRNAISGFGANGAIIITYTCPSGICDFEARANGFSTSAQTPISNNLVLSTSAGAACATLEYAWSDGINYWNGSSFLSATPVYNTAYSSITVPAGAFGRGTYTAYARCQDNIALTASDGIDVLETCNILYEDFGTGSDQSLAAGNTYNGWTEGTGTAILTGCANNNSSGRGYKINSASTDCNQLTSFGYRSLTKSVNITGSSTGNYTLSFWNKGGSGGASGLRLGATTLSSSFNGGTSPIIYTRRSYTFSSPTGSNNLEFRTNDAGSGNYINLALGLDDICLTAGADATPSVYLWGSTGNQSVDCGASVSFTAYVMNATGYQWKLNGNDISGATNATYTIAPVSESDTGTYTCYVTNSVSNVTTTGATLSLSSACGGTPTLNVGSLTGFGDVCINTTAGPNSFTISGTDLTSADVTVSSLAGFTFSTTSNGTYSSSLSLSQPGGIYNQTIYVKFSPTAVQSYDGNIVVVGGGASSVNRSVTGSGINTLPAVTSPSSSNLSFTTVTLGGNISDLGCSSVTERGIFYSTTNGFADGAGTKVSETPGPYSTGAFTVNVTGLSAATIYYYKAFATNSAGSAYSSQGTFTTLTPTPTLQVSALTAFGNVCTNTTAGPNSFTITGDYLTSADVTVGSLTGYTFSTTSGGTYTSSLTLSQGGGTYTQDIYVKFTPTAVQSYNGNIVVGGGGASSVNCSASGSGINIAPTVGSPTSAAVTSTSATLGGNISAIGCPNPTERGIYYSTTNGFADGSGTKVSETPGPYSTGAFNVGVTGLSPSTTYYYKAFSTNSGGAGYSTQGTFTTATPSISVGSITGFGNVCPNTSAGPNSFTITGTNLTTADVTVAALSGYTYSTASGGPYTSTLSLSQGGGTYGPVTIYVMFLPTAVQSYNGNIVVGGGGASNVNRSVTGSGANSVSVSSPSSSSVTDVSAVLGGNITSIGCTNVTERGIYWSTTNGFANGTGTRVSETPGPYSTGAFTINVSGLSPGTVYYYKAFATNSVGSGYSAQGTFTTLSPILSVSSLADFGTVCLNTEGGPNSFTITGTYLTTANVNVAALNGYTYSTSIGGPYTSSLSITQPGGSFSQTVYVKLTPTAEQSYNGNIVVGGGGAGNVNCSATGMSNFSVNTGSGTNGVYIAPAGTSTLAGGIYNYTSFTIPVGSTVTVTGTAPLDIRCTGTVTIDGTLDLSGNNGGDATNASYSSYGLGGAGGGGGGMNGGNGGRGGEDFNYTITAGTAGSAFPGSTGGGGGGPKGPASTSVSAGGGGAGYSTAGFQGGNNGLFYNQFATVGAVYGDATLSTTLNGTKLLGGSGGGGGGGCYANASPAQFPNGGGGGGGGGGVKISANIIAIGGSGIITVKGGNGGKGVKAPTLTNYGGSGGGGSGGTVSLGYVTSCTNCGTAPNTPSSNINISGGTGGSYSGGQSGGNGATGRFLLTGSSTSPLPTGSASQSFCSGATVTNLSATGTGIKWYDAASGGNLLLSSALLVNGTAYYASQTLAGKCESTDRLAVTATVNICSSTWEGNISTSWNDGLNWNPVGVPDGCGAEVSIPGNTVRKPVINSAVSVGDIEIQSGASLTLNADLNICGDFTGSNTTTAALLLGNGTAILSGPAQQTISGRVRFNTLQINNNSVTGDGDVVLANGAQVSVATGLHLQSGNMTTTGGTLTLLSTASNNNSYIDDFSYGLTPGTITGNVQIQRYVPTPGRNQHFVSSPVNGAALSQFGASGPDGAYMTPTADCSKLLNAPGSAYGTVFVYNDARVPAHTCAMANWHVQSSGNMVNGKGYSAYLTGNSILTVSGTPNTGNIDVTGVHSGNAYVNIEPLNEPIESGWNLVGNPYPSTIVLNSTANDHAGFDNQVQVWQTSGPFSGSWQTLDMASGAAIAPFQAFMVHRTGAGPHAFHFYQNERSRATNTTFYRAASENSLTLEVDYNGSKDLTRIEFNPEATNGFDSEYDANKPGGDVYRPTLYTHLNTNMWYSTNTLPSLQEATVVPMGLAGLFNGTLTITAKGIQSFDPTTYIFLEDKKTNVWHNLRNGDYTFTKTSTDNQDRFVVHFTPAAKILVTDAACKNSGTINITQSGSANWNYTLTDENNTTLSSGTLNSANAVSIQANAGLYHLTLTDQNGYTVMKNIEVNGTQPVISNFILSSTAAEVNEEISFSATTTNADSYHWDFGDGTTATTQEAFHHYKAEGIYQVSLTVSNVAGCKSSRTQTVTVTSRSATALPNLLTPKPISIWSSDDMVYVDFTQQKRVEAEIELYNVLGQMISREKFGNSTIYSKQISNLAAAYIIVRVKNEENVTTKKVFINGR